MLTCEDERRRLGAAARDLAMAEHDARTNAGRILDVLKSCAATRTHARG
jgi:hypothetical protein